MNTDEFKKLLLKLKSDKKFLIIFILGISGMLLVMLSGTQQETEHQASAKAEHSVINEKDLAYDVEKFVSSIKDAGKSKVILTFESYEETVYALNNDEEKDEDGSYNQNNEYVIVDNDNTETGLKLKIISPKVRGVAILCEGGDNPIVKEQITTAISVLFDISSNKVSVATMAG